MDTRMQPGLGDALFRTPLGDQLGARRDWTKAELAEMSRFLVQSPAGNGAQLLLPGMPTTERDREARALARDFVEHG